MATFVLVHGAWQGSWCWKRVREVLQAWGHHVFTPTLTGLGERSHLLSPRVDLETHIQDVANLIRWEELSDVILCGHAYGGSVITGVASLLPDRIGELVYLDAFVPEDGQSVFDMLPGPRRARHLEAAAREGDGWKVPPVPAEVFNVKAVDREWVDRQCTPQPIATFRQAARVGEGEGVPRRATYILATRHVDSPFRVFFERARAMGWKTLALPCGHDLMLDRPEELAGALLEIGETQLV